MTRPAKMYVRQDMNYSLATDGVTVVHIPDLPLRRTRKEFYKTCNNFPEYRRDHTQQYVLGGFAALGNPASFHNPLVRKLREWCMAALMPEFRGVAQALPVHFRLEQMYDRMMLRLAGESPSKESWHRDEDTAATNDIKFGGWCNLDSTPQFFSCIRGSHSPAGSRGGGFKKLTPVEQKELNNDKDKIMVEIPPGSIVIFYENIIHEVLATKATHDMCRLFLGWRFTTRDPTMLPETAAVIRDQGVPKLKSGQVPPMYARLHLVNHRLKLQRWSLQQMNSRCLEDVAMASGKQQWWVYRVVMRLMPPLRQLFPERMYRPYSERQKDVFVPSRHWKLLMPGRDRLVKEYRL